MMFFPALVDLYLFIVWTCEIVWVSVAFNCLYILIVSEQSKKENNQEYRVPQLVWSHIIIWSELFSLFSSSLPGADNTDPLYTPLPSLYALLP